MKRLVQGVVAFAILITCIGFASSAMATFIPHVTWGVTPTTGGIEDGWANSPVRLSVFDTLPPGLEHEVIAYYYKGDDSSAATTYTGSPVSESTEGITTYNAYAIDETSSTVGPTTACSVKIDEHPPVITTDAQSMYVGSARISMNATDSTVATNNVSGIPAPGQGYYVDDLHYYNWTLDGGPESMSTVVTCNDVGNHTLVVVARDMAENATTETVHFTVTAPPLPAAPGAATGLKVGADIGGWKGIWSIPDSLASSTKVWYDNVPNPLTAPVSAVSLSGNATSYTFATPLPGTYYWHVQRLGDGGISAITSGQFIVPKPSVSTKLKLSSASSLRKGKKLSVRIALSPTAAGGKGKLTFQYKKGKSWKTAKTVSVALKGGKASYSYKPSRKGSWHVKASYSGQTTAAKVYKTSTATKTFKVK